MEQKIKVYINSDALKVSPLGVPPENLIGALAFMQNRWPHIVEVYFFGDNAARFGELNGLKYSIIDKSNLPTKADKLHHLIDDKQETLYWWESIFGKAISYSYRRNKTDSWNGFNIVPTMTKDEIINVFRHTMHLYN